jgi:hypothetical protein
MNKETEYHLFGGEVYYAKGGINDYICSSKSLDALLLKMRELANSDEYYLPVWFHICDENFKIVEKSEDKPYGS